MADFFPDLEEPTSNNRNDTPPDVPEKGQSVQNAGTHRMKKLKSSICPHPHVMRLRLAHALTRIEKVNDLLPAARYANEWGAPVT
jgi:hypothetical protein